MISWTDTGRPVTSRHSSQTRSTQLLNAAQTGDRRDLDRRPRRRQLSSSTIEVAKAELALRDGKHLSAQTFAQTALTLAGEDARGAGAPRWLLDEQPILDRARNQLSSSIACAESLRQSARDKREALWGQLMARQRSRWTKRTISSTFSSQLPIDSDPYEIVRMADKKLGAGTSFRLRYGT